MRNSYANNSATWLMGLLAIVIAGISLATFSEVRKLTDDVSALKAKEGYVVFLQGEVKDLRSENKEIRDRISDLEREFIKGGK